MHAMAPTIAASAGNRDGRAHAAHVAKNPGLKNLPLNKSKFYNNICAEGQEHANVSLAKNYADGFAYGAERGSQGIRIL